MGSISEIGQPPGIVADRAASPAPAQPTTNEQRHGSACPNCQADLIGPFCHGCGQSAHLHRTTGAFLHDLLHGAFHFEGKIWRTLPELTVRPGELTRRYIAGERARFVSPMALFLFSVFLMFAVFQIVGVTPPTDFEEPVQVVDGDGNLLKTRQQLEELRDARAGLESGNPLAPILDRQIARLGQQLGAAERTETAAGGEETFTLETGIPFVDHAVGKWRKNPALMFYKLQANSYKFSWLLIPLSIPFMWLIFAWRRRFGAYDHAVFVTYSLGFMTLLLIALTLLGYFGAPGGAIVLGATAIPLVHIYRQLKGAYSLSRFSALWRTGALSLSILLILFLFLDVLLLLGAMG